MGFLAVLIKTISLCFVIHSCASSCGCFKDCTTLEKVEWICTVSLRLVE